MDYIGLIVSIVGGVLSLVGIIINIILNKRKRLSVYKESNVLIHNSELTNKNPKLMITFDDQIIPNMTTTLITIWCSGNDVIRKSDAEDYPWKIVASGESEILDVTILKSTVPHVNVQLKNSHEAVVTFNNFDKRQGVVFQVIHTGDSSSVSFVHQILGGSNGTHSTDDNELNAARWRYAKKIYCICVCLLLFLTSSKEPLCIILGLHSLSSVEILFSFLPYLDMIFIFLGEILLLIEIIEKIEKLDESFTYTSRIPQELYKYATFRK